MAYIARIYKIVNTINDEIYVGSTRNELRLRWQGHKKDYTRVENGLYLMMREHGFEPFRIILIEEIEVRNKTEQLQHEQRYIDQLRPTLNKINANGIKKCEHQRRRSECKECGGASICEHNRQRSQCKDCGGASICEHQRFRSSCKDCGGSQVKPVYCADCDIEIIKQHYIRHLNTKKHLRNTLPINL